MRGVSHRLNVDTFFLIFLRKVKIFYKSAILDQKWGCLRTFSDAIYRTCCADYGGASCHPTNRLIWANCAGYSGSVTVTSIACPASVIKNPGFLRLLVPLRIFMASPDRCSLGSFVVNLKNKANFGTSPGPRFVRAGQKDLPQRRA